ncbi:MAG: folate-binding protein YgfZ [Magnetococcales bacterium]|nr:folate-binding protein YgfZ [Magnetococcales bacterium]MBF0157160.1 folate-binding protein YgfZ [Magnetococcales bacterium]
MTLSRLLNHHAAGIVLTEDRGARTPARYVSDPVSESVDEEGAALIDFSHFGVVVVRGEERVDFLSGLITNQVRKATATQVVYSALLSPQGRFLWDFTIVARSDALLLVTEPDRVRELVAQLNFYKLRSKVTISEAEPEEGLLGLVGGGSAAALARVFPGFDGSQAGLGSLFTPEPGVALWRDPRHADFGWRLLASEAVLSALWDRLTGVARPTGWEAWEHYRQARCLPRAGAEFMVGTSLPLESGLKELNGVDFGKGCYVGQETTARTHHRGTIKKRLFRVGVVGSSPPPVGTLVLDAGGREIGVLTSLSPRGGVGLAILKPAEFSPGDQLRAGDCSVEASRPDWAEWE